VLVPAVLSLGDATVYMITSR